VSKKEVLYLCIYMCEVKQRMVVFIWLF